MFKLWRIRDRVRRLGEWRRRRRASLERLRDLDPVFVIGGNRSGTSIVASVLSQHPDLEGLFGGALKGSYNEAGHSIGFCESMHVWPDLMPDASQRRARGQLGFWALPQFIGQAYRERARDDAERLALAWNVERHRRTVQQPLIKDQFNMLRVGLIADVFPRARFVLVARSWEDFTARAIQKWATDGLGSVLNAPVAGFHWHMVNLVARYDLQIHAPGRYGVVWLDTLHAGQEQARRVFADVTRTLGLGACDYDLESLSRHWAPRGGACEPSTDAGFEAIPRIVEFERRLLDNLSDTTHHE
jgi:hypothetical protein